MYDMCAQNDTEVKISSKSMDARNVLDIVQQDINKYRTPPQGGQTHSAKCHRIAE